MNTAKAKGFPSRAEQRECKSLRSKTEQKNKTEYRGLKFSLHAVIENSSDSQTVLRIIGTASSPRWWNIVGHTEMH